MKIGKWRKISPRQGFTEAWYNPALETYILMKENKGIWYVKYQMMYMERPDKIETSVLSKFPTKEKAEKWITKTQKKYPE